MRRTARAAGTGAVRAGRGARETARHSRPDRRVSRPHPLRAHGRRARRAACPAGADRATRKKERGPVVKPDRKRRAFLLALGLAVAGRGAGAVTIGAAGPRPWTTPGTNPCGGPCDRDWALGQMRQAMPAEVHAELTRRIAAGEPSVADAVATGDRIVAMSYAKDGVPYVELSERVARFPAGCAISPAAMSSSTTGRPGVLSASRPAATGR